MSYAHISYSPSTSPSPPSSPAYLDSSPPSSPSLEPITLPPSPQTLVHPLAGSAKANRAPREYEKKPIAKLSNALSPSPSKKARYGHRATDSQNTVTLVFDPDDEDTFGYAFKPLASPVFPKTAEEIEAEVWDEASTRVIDGSNGTVELGYVPYYHCH